MLRFLTAPIGTARLGKLGERRAAWFYRLRGYRVVGRNVHLAAGEIDLVVQRGKTLVIAEVKTRQSLATGDGVFAVDGIKRARLVRLAEEYVNRSRLRDVVIRYDVLSLFWTGYRFVVHHFPDAFRPVADPVRPWRWRV